jgi:hypothetical protein
MKVQAFLHRHYSPDLGESPIGHATAVLAGLTLMMIGGAMVATIVLVPLGFVLGLVGLMLLAGGVFAHIQGPLTFGDLLDTIVGLTGAAIAMTFSITVLAMAVGLTFTALYAFVQWLGR